MSGNKRKSTASKVMNTDPLANLAAEPAPPTRVKRALCAAILACGLAAQAVPPPNGVAPVTTPAGGFGIDGHVVAGPLSGDWMPGPNGAAGVLDATGAPLNPATTFHFTDPYNSKSDNTFSGGKWMDNPNTWTWTLSGAQSKGDVNNVLMHVATDTNLHTWLILAADRAAVSGASYIDFELLQNTLVANTNGTFTSAGPNGGRTVNDLLLTLSFKNGGASADFLAYRWLTNSSGGGYAYADATTNLPAGKVFVAANTNTVAVPFGAFGQTNYQPTAFVEAAVDMTALMGAFDPCLSIGVKTLMVKTKSSTSTSGSLVDFVGPIQYRILLGPGADAGPDQTQCTQGSSTAFALQGVASRGFFPIASTSWSVVSGSATIDAPSSVTTTAHVSSPSATLRLTVVQANGCTGTSDVVLTVNPIPTSTIAGPASVLPQSTTQFSGPAGMSNYTWSVSGNASISGSVNSQTVSVVAGSTCGATYTLSLDVSANGCGSTARTNILISDTGLPMITAPANLTLECPANTSTSATGVASAHDNSGNLPVTYSDAVTSTCGGATKVITRTWTAVNICGYSVSAAQIITVQDTTPPTVTAPPNATLAFTADISPSSTGVATAQDGCSSVTLQHSDALTVNPDGSQVISRTWTATDGCGNLGSAIQTIALNAPSPLILPTQSDIVLTNLITLVVTNTATNPNASTNPLSYQLINPPAGVSIDSNGIITWTPSLSESPSTNIITTVVTTTVNSAVGASTISSTNSFVVTITTPYDGLDMSVDTDGDGLTNLVEFAVGSDPNNSADGNSRIIIWITQTNGNHYLAMKFTRRVNAAALGLQYLPEVTADKVNWASDNANVLVLSVAPFDTEFDWVTVLDQTPITPSMARFIRLHIISTSLESFSPVWIGSDTLIKGSVATASRTTFFSQRMVLPVLYAGTVSSVQNTALTDTNGTWTPSQFGNGGVPAYAEFDNGSMADIASSTGSKSLSLADSLNGAAAPGDAYRIRGHFTIASLFGTNNETGLQSGGNTAQADTIQVLIPGTQQTLTIFYYDDGVNHGWLTADYTLADNLVIYPEQGLLVTRVAAGDRDLYLCGPVKMGVTVAPVQPGYNLVGTLKSLSALPLSALNLYTGDPATGLASGGNTVDSDILMVIQPDGTAATYFYYKDNQGNEGWLDANYNLSADVPINPGTAFFIHRLPTSAGFNWIIPAE
jgi:hypothetical protein